MADSNLINRYFNRFKSGVRMGIYESRLAAYVEYGRIMGARLEESVEHAYQSHVIGGQTRETQSRATGSTCTLSGTFMETLNPMTMQLLAQDYTDTQTITQNCSVVSLKWSHPLFWTEKLPVVPRAAICTLARLAPITSVVPSVGGASGTWAATNYYFWVQPCYGTKPTAGAGMTYSAGEAMDICTVLNANMDRVFTAGTSVASGIQAIGVAERLTLTVTLPALGADEPLPDFYITYYGTTSTQASSKVALITDNTITRSGGTQAILCDGTVQAGNDVYQDAENICVQTIASFSTGSPTLTKRTEGTDYTYNQTTGYVYRIDGGAITNGEQCVFTYWRIKPPYVRTSLGGGNSNNDFRQVTLIGIEVDPDNDNHTAETSMGLGESIVLYKVDFGGLGFTLDFDGMAFEDGRSFSARVLMGDDETYGYIDQESRVFVNWVQNYR